LFNIVVKIIGLIKAPTGGTVIPVAAVELK